MPNASEAHKRVQRIIIAFENVGGSRYSAEDAMFDITQVYTETFGSSDRWIGDKK